jgi:hypothetical protein
MLSLVKKAQCGLNLSKVSSQRSLMIHNQNSYEAIHSH